MTAERCGYCRACELERIGCPCDGSLGNGCWICSPDSALAEQRPPCPPLHFKHNAVIKAAEDLVHGRGDQTDLFFALRTAVMAVHETATKAPDKRTVEMYLGSIKDPDGWQELLYELIPRADEEKDAFDKDHPNEKRRRALSDKYFEFGEYAEVEVVFDEDLNIVGGRLVPRRKG